MNCYEAGYVAYHTTSVLVVVAVVVILLSAPVYASALTFVLAVCMHMRCSRVRVRSGCSCGRAPRSEAEVLAIFRQTPSRTPVGSGWNAYLQRQAPARPVHLHLFYNTEPFSKMYGAFKSEHWWRAGTTIGTVAAYYKIKNKAFGSLPSLESATLGSWIWSGSHGSSGNAGVSSTDVFKYVRFLTVSGDVHTVTYKDFEKDTCIVILHVSFDFRKLVPNMWLHKRAIPIDPTRPFHGVDEWLRPSYQRAIFVGKRIIGLQWSTSKMGPEEFEHRDPHCCSRVCLWVRTDPCNAACGCCWKPLQNYASRVQLYDVNRFVPPVWRFSLLALVGCGHYNCEIFCKVPTGADPKTFFSTLVQRCYAAHSKSGGRTELRYNGRTVFVDVAAPMGGFDNIFNVLENLGVKQYALHEGKFQWVAHTNMKKVTPKAIYTSHTKPATTSTLNF